MGTFENSEQESITAKSRGGDCHLGSPSGVSLCTKSFVTAWSRKHWLVGRKTFETIWLKCSECSLTLALGKGASYLLLVTAVAAEATKETG